jgi:hypothetical protein
VIAFPDAAMRANADKVPIDCKQPFELLKCPSMLFGWTLGNKGSCYPDSYGLLLGKGGVTGIWMQVQLNIKLAYYWLLVISIEYWQLSVVFKDYW